jgi:transcriptional regulator of acetoin/glycerol metabolism
MNNTDLRDLRRQWQRHGAAPTSMALEQLGSTLGSSWQRCFQFGLQPSARRAAADHVLGSENLRIRIEQREQLIRTAIPTLDYLHALIAGTGGVVILADHQGVIVHSVGDADFLHRADRVLLRPGASWQERHRGTNAIGTALHEGRAVAVNGAEHFFDENGFLSCTASPIRGPDGRTLGVLDISSDQRSHHPHTLGLVRTSVRAIERQLFAQVQGPQTLRVTCHPDVAGLGSMAEGLLHLDESGLITAMDSVAMAQLGLQSQAIGQLRLPQWMVLDWKTVLDQALAQEVITLQPQTLQGRTLYLRIDASRFRLKKTPPPPLFETTPHLPLRDISRLTVEQTLLDTHGNIAESARRLGISRSTLYRHLKR